MARNGKYRKCFEAERTPGGVRVAVKSIKTGKTTSYIAPGGIRVKNKNRAEVYPSKRIAYANARGYGLHKSCPV